MNWQDANMIIRLIHGHFLWCGVPVSLAAGHRSKKEAKYDLDATFAYWHTRAQERTVLSKFQKDSKRTVTSPKETQPRGRGMTRRADKFFAKKMVGGLKPERPALRTIAGSPDGYHSAKETSDFDDDPRRKHKMWSLRRSFWTNPITPTLVLSYRAAPLFIVNAVQRKIGTGKELAEG